MRSHTPLLYLALTGTTLITPAYSLRTMIPSTCFNSQADFDTDWANLYPWGSDHNGAARMNASHIQIANNQLTLTATPVTGQPNASSGGKSIPIHYLAGTVHAKEQFTIQKTGGYDYYAEFQATTTKGTWPAFWLTAVNGWPPEIDLAEWKGDGKISFNTFNTSSEVAAKDVTYSNPGNWHAVKVECREVNGSDVQCKFYLDGVLEATQTGKGFVAKAMWLILDLQMEGSSGSPGPTGTTTFAIRNLSVLSYNP